MSVSYTHLDVYKRQVYSRTQLLYFLFGLAKADGTVCKHEISLLDKIANLLGIDSTTYQSIKALSLIHISTIPNNIKPHNNRNTKLRQSLSLIHI